MSELSELFGLVPDKKWAWDWLIGSRQQPSGSRRTLAYEVCDFAGGDVVFRALPRDLAGRTSGFCLLMSAAMGRTRLS